MMSQRRPKCERIVIGAEGSDEETFLNHLCSLYIGDRCNWPKIVPCGGCKPKRALTVMRQTTPGIGGYSDRVILLDKDRNNTKICSAMEEAKKRPKIKIIWADNRLECELLRLANGVSQKMLSRAMKDNGQIAKQEFAKICDGNLTGTALSYDKVFPKTLLDEKCKTSSWLSEILGYIEKTQLIREMGDRG